MRCVLQSFVFPQDRLILGSNCTYLFVGYPSERGTDDWSRYDYDYFQSELAAAAGICLGEQQRTGQGGQPHVLEGQYEITCLCSGESSCGSSETDPSLLAVFYDYTQLMPMAAEANQMSQELNKVTLSGACFLTRASKVCDSGKTFILDVWFAGGGV